MYVKELDLVVVGHHACCWLKHYAGHVACRVTLKLGPRYDMGDLAPSKEDGWKRTLKGNDWAIWEKC